MAAIQMYVPDANRIIHSSSVDFVTRMALGQPVHVVQYDNKLPIIEVLMYKSGEEYMIPEGAEASVRVGKKDRTFVINPVLGCDSTRKKLYIEITQQMVAIWGDLYPVIEIVVDNKLACSSSIHIMVDKNPVQEGDIESANEFKQLVEYVGEAEASKNAAAKSASESAQSASKSAASAAESQTQANNSAQSAEASASSAAQSANSASASEQSAQASANSAAESLASANASEASAENSAQSAQSSLDHANASANSASASASSAIESAQYAENSAASASDSADSATEAENQALEAKAQAEASANSATESSSYADASEQSKSESAQYAENSATSATQSAESASASADSATASAASAAEAAASAEEIKGWDKLAESYAHGQTDVRPGEETDNAQYYFEQCKNITIGLQGALLPMGSIPFEELETQSKNTGYMYNITNEFVTTDGFREGSGIPVAAGANVYWSADEVWDILSPSTVTGIKGNAEESFRMGSVNITKENIGLDDASKLPAEDTKSFARHPEEGVTVQKILDGMGDTVRVLQQSLVIPVPATGWTEVYPYTNTVTTDLWLYDWCDSMVSGLYLPNEITEAEYKAKMKAFSMLMSNPDKSAITTHTITFKAYKRPTVDFSVIITTGYNTMSSL